MYDFNAINLIWGMANNLTTESFETSVFFGDDAEEEKSDEEEEDDDEEEKDDDEEEEDDDEEEEGEKGTNTAFFDEVEKGWFLSSENGVVNLLSPVHLSI